jgi:hypothetical protein
MRSLRSLLCKSLKILTAAGPAAVAYFTCPIRGLLECDVMIEKTCAACDCKLDENAIKVKLSGKIVEVCCDECAQKLKEAHGTAAP